MGDDDEREDPGSLAKNAVTEGLDVVAYGTIAGKLGAAVRSRREILAEHGLDESLWNALDDAWQAMLSSAIDTSDDGVPALVTAFAEAFARGQRGETNPEVISLERYAEATRGLMRARGDVEAALKGARVTLAEFLFANEHWARRMIEDDAIAARFNALLKR